MLEDGSWEMEVNSVIAFSHQLIFKFFYILTSVLSLQTSNLLISKCQNHSTGDH